MASDPQRHIPRRILDPYPFVSWLLQNSPILRVFNWSVFAGIRNTIRAFVYLRSLFIRVTIWNNKYTF